MIQYGYRPEFHSKPPLMLHPWQNLASNSPRIAEAVQSLLQKNAVRLVDLSRDGQGFYSHLFVVPKKSGGLRPVLNLSALNKYVRNHQFRMETNRSVIAAVQPDDWMISIDLKDAYFHIAIHPECHRYFRFVANGKVYEYTALPFGLSTAPRIFTSIVNVPVGALHKMAVKLHPHLDDWLVRDTHLSLIHI